MKVLLADDDADLLDLMTYALRREGYTTVAAIDGKQALARFATERPELVLLDVTMPKVNGFEVCRRIRQEAETPIILLTACDQEEDVVRGFQLGADDYVTKPFSVKQLVHRMQAVMRRCRADQYAEPVREVRVGDSGARPAILRGDQRRDPGPTHAVGIPHSVPARNEPGAGDSLFAAGGIRLGL